MYIEELGWLLTKYITIPILIIAAIGYGLYNRGRKQKQREWMK